MNVLPASSNHDSSELISARLAVRLNSSSDPDDTRLESTRFKGLDSTAETRKENRLIIQDKQNYYQTHLKGLYQEKVLFLESFLQCNE